MKNYTREMDKFVQNKEIIKFEKSNGEKVEIWLTRTTADKKHKNDLMNCWVARGWVKEFIADRISVEVFATDKKGNCYGWYNPLHRLTSDKKRVVINFDYILEDTASNRDKIIKKVLELATTKKALNEIKSEIIGA